jgi:hypothetical protein
VLPEAGFDNAIAPPVRGFIRGHVAFPPAKTSPPGFPTFKVSQASQGSQPQRFLAFWQPSQRRSCDTLKKRDLSHSHAGL